VLVSDNEPVKAGLDLLARHAADQQKLINPYS